MKKLKLLALLSLVTINFVLADEYISDAYFEEISSQSEFMYESLDSLPIIQTIEEQQRILEEQHREEQLVIPPITEEIIQTNSTSISPVSEGKQSIHENTYLNVLKQARNEGKIIMFTIRSTDCKYCDRMEEGTLSDESVKGAIEANFININYNQDLDILPLGLQNGATPMFIFINTKEDILNMYPGIRTPAEFKEVLEQILAM